MSVLDTCTAALGDPNGQAFLHVIGAGESNERLDDAAYRICNVGPPLSVWEHPWYGRSTTEVGHSTAAGAFQFLGTSWKEASDALGLGNEFTPINQQLAAIWTISEKRHALQAVMEGNLVTACSKLATEWVSLPGLGLKRVQDVFLRYGGSYSAQPTPSPSVTQSQGKPMPFLALLSAFGPIIAQLIPQITNIVRPKGEVAQRNIELAKVAFDTITKAAGASNVQDAVEKMQDDPVVKEAVTQAVLTHPQIIETLQVVEFGGGVEKAADRGLAIQQAERPFWYNPIVWVTVLLIPMMYMISWQVLFTFAGPVLTSNGVDGAPLVMTPWYAQIGFDSNTRTGLINLIVGFIFGGVCGIWFGTSVSRQKTEQATTAVAAK